MKPKFLLLIGLALCMNAARAQEWSGALYYDVKARQSYAVVLTRLATFSKAAGTRLSLDLDAFAGLNSASYITGFLVGKRFPIADKIEGYAGFGAQVSSGRAIGFGGAVGIAVRF